MEQSRPRDVSWHACPFWYGRYEPGRMGTARTAWRVPMLFNAADLPVLPPAILSSYPCSVGFLCFYIIESGFIFLLPLRNPLLVCAVVTSEDFEDDNTYSQVRERRRGKKKKESERTPSPVTRFPAFLPSSRTTRARAQKGTETETDTSRNPRPYI